MRLIWTFLPSVQLRDDFVTASIPTMRKCENMREQLQNIDEAVSCLIGFLAVAMVTFRDFIFTLEFEVDDLYRQELVEFHAELHRFFVHVDNLDRDREDAIANGKSNPTIQSAHYLFEVFLRYLLNYHNVDLTKSYRSKLLVLLHLYPACQHEWMFGTNAIGISVSQHCSSSTIDWFQLDVELQGAIEHEASITKDNIRQYGIFKREKHAKQKNASTNKIDNIGSDHQGQQIADREKGKQQSKDCEPSKHCEQEILSCQVTKPILIMEFLRSCDKNASQ